jgi:two-component system, LytTR family, response regulator
MKTIMIVDDERDGRLLLREQLESYENVAVIAECDNGREAVSQINRLRPDVVFLDIHLPGYNGFAVISELDYHPQVIITTASSHYAVKAFDHDAIDYLLKPWTPERFHLAMQKIGGTA